MNTTNQVKDLHEPAEIAEIILGIIEQSSTVKEAKDNYGEAIVQIEMRPVPYLDMMVGLKRIRRYAAQDTAETTKDARDLHAYFNHATTIFRPEQIHPPTPAPRKYIWIKMENETWKRTLNAVLRIIRRENTNNA